MPDKCSNQYKVKNINSFKKFINYLKHSIQISNSYYLITNKQTNEPTPIKLILPQVNNKNPMDNKNIPTSSNLLPLTKLHNPTMVICQLIL